MPHDGSGTGWDETLPQDSDNTSDGPQEIRDLRKGVALRLAKEHVDPDAASVGGEHLKGSAKAYYQTAFPSKRPDTTTDLGAGDAGRLFLKDTSGALHYWDGTAWQSMKIADVDQIVDGILTKAKVATGFTSGILPYAILKDEKADGTNGGTFTSGVWQTRAIAEDTDAGGIVTVAANQFTLGAGTYRIRASAVAYQCDQHQVRIRNITAGSTPGYGTMEKSAASDGSVTRSEVVCETTIAVSSVFELQHRCGTTKATNGYGPAGTLGGSEVFAIVEIWKLL